MTDATTDDRTDDRNEAWKPATVAVTAGRPPHEPDQPLNRPVTLASTYVAGGDLEYGRYANPTWSAFEEALERNPWSARALVGLSAIASQRGDAAAQARWDAKVCQVIACAGE